MTNIVYTHHMQTPKSSVIADIYYVDTSEEMFVVLNSGVIAGYVNVPFNVYQNFAAQESLGGSVGKYWNEWIKPYFNGQSTDHIDDFVSVNDATHAWQPVEDISKAEEVKLPEADTSLKQYVFNFEDGDCFGVYSDNFDDAQERLNKIAELAQWPDTTVVSVTLIF
jgi:hypothetical protein